MLTLPACLPVPDPSNLLEFTLPSLFFHHNSHRGSRSAPSCSHFKTSPQDQTPINQGKTPVLLKPKRRANSEASVSSYYIGHGTPDYLTKSLVDKIIGISRILSPSKRLESKTNDEDHPLFPLRGNKGVGNPPKPLQSQVITRQILPPPERL